jgi:hypothetical protein
MALSDRNKALVERELGAPLLYMDLDRAELNRLLDAARSEAEARERVLVEALRRLEKPAPGVKMLPPWAVGIIRATLGELAKDV